MPPLEVALLFEAALARIAISVWGKTDEVILSVSICARRIPVFVRDARGLEGAERRLCSRKRRIRAEKKYRDSSLALGMTFAIQRMDDVRRRKPLPLSS